jgi:hypothetical protein
MNIMKEELVQEKTALQEIIDNLEKDFKNKEDKINNLLSQLNTNHEVIEKCK